MPDKFTPTDNWMYRAHTRIRHGAVIIVIRPALYDSGTKVRNRSSDGRPKKYWESRSISLSQKSTVPLTAMDTSG